MFKQLEKITGKPKPFEFYTTPYLWNDEYISKKMLEMHLNPNVEAASRDHEFINRSVKWICETFNVSSNSLVCDFGCGPGLYTNQFAKTGAKVTGIDLSTRSIDYANNKADYDLLEIEYLNINYLDFIPTRKYDLITMIYCDFSVLSPYQVNLLLEIFKNALKPNGKLLFDVFSKNWFKNQNESIILEISENDGFWSNQKYYAFKKTFKYENESIYLDKYTLVQDNSEKEIFNWLQCYDEDELKNLLLEKGFIVKDLYANVAGDNYKTDSDIITVVAHFNG